MADEENPEEEGQAAEGKAGGDEVEKKGPKGSIKLVGGIVAVVAMGGALAMMALPSKPQEKRFAGPFYVALSESPIAINTTDANYTRYVKFTPHAEFIAYESSYVASRTRDPFYTTYLRALIEEVVSDKDIEAVLKGRQRQVFAEELRHAIAPIVFPIHIGATPFPLDIDSTSGLRPGLSHTSSTFGGPFHDHVLKVDGPAKTLQVDDGPAVDFQGNEEDLQVMTTSGKYLFVDVSHYKPDFVGDVPVGVHGKLRKVLILEGIAQ